MESRSREILTTLFLVPLVLTVCAVSKALSFNHSHQHVSATGIYCDDPGDDIFSEGAFVRFNNNPGQGWIWSGNNGPGKDGDKGAGMGIRLDSANLPSVSWSMDLKLAHPIPPGLQSSFSFNWIDSNGVPHQVKLPLSNLAGSDITATPLSNGYTRYTFNGVAHGISNGKWRSIYFIDYGVSGGPSGTNMITNFKVNDISATPDLHSTPTYDCNN